MKTKFFILGIFVLTISVLFSCKKEEDSPTPTPTPTNNNSTVDSIAPVITIIGQASMTLSLNTLFTDPGAIATDAHDGPVIVSSDASSTNPNMNHTGTYTITYTSIDSIGNISTLIRTVIVVNDAASFEGNYAVHDSIPGMSFFYNQTITVDATINNRVHFNLFGFYANNVHIFANKILNGNLEIPSQTASNIGSGPGSCDIATHQFSSISYTSLSNGFILVYDDVLTSPSVCAGQVQGIATYIRI